MSGRVSHEYSEELSETPADQVHPLPCIIDHSIYYTTTLWRERHHHAPLLQAILEETSTLIEDAVRATHLLPSLHRCRARHTPHHLIGSRQNEADARTARHGDTHTSERVEGGQAVAFLSGRMFPDTYPVCGRTRSRCVWRIMTKRTTGRTSSGLRSHLNTLGAHTQ